MGSGGKGKTLAELLRPPKTFTEQYAPTIDWKMPGSKVPARWSQLSSAATPKIYQLAEALEDAGLGDLAEQILAGQEQESIARIVDALKKSGASS